MCESLKNVLESEATAHVRFQVLGEENEGRPEILLGFCQVRASGYGFWQRLAVMQSSQQLL